MTTAKGHHVSTFSGAPRRRQASSLRSAPFGAIGLDRASVAPKAGNYVMAQGTARTVRIRALRAGREETMNHAYSPAVDVTIGGQTRIYHAFITTAPATYDGPSTLTLYESSFADVAGFAADAIPFDHDLGRQTARLVLIGSTELEWQRARYREGRYLLAQTDPVLVGLRTLQHWLWNRLAAPVPSEVH